MKKSLSERIAVLEVKIEELSKHITNHTSVHKFDRIIQALNLIGISICLFLLKIAIFK